MLLASSLMLCCLVTLPDVARRWPAMQASEPAVAGWCGVAALLAAATAGTTLLLADRLGSGPPLALGAVTAGLGLALASSITDGAELLLALVALGVAVGALFGAGPCLLDELPAPFVRATLVGWLAPWCAGWGIVGWFALRDARSPELRLGLHAGTLWLAAWVAGLVGWSLLTLVAEPERRRPSGNDADRARWENAWAALAGVVVGSGCLALVIGFQPQLPVAWGRPVVLLSVLVAVAGLAVTGLVLPVQALRAGHLAIVVALGLGPACVHVLMLGSAQRSGPLGGWLPVLLGAAGLLGVVAGWRWGSGAVVGGLLAMACSAAGGWVMPARPPLMTLAAAPLAAGIAAASSGAIRLAVRDRLGLRFLAIAGLVSLLIGLVALVPVTWALGASLTGPATDAQPGGRVLLGLMFAVTVLASAVCAVISEGSAADGAALSRDRTPHLRSPAAPDRS